MFFVTGPGKEYLCKGGDVADLSLSPDGQVLLILVGNAVQLWSAGYHRVRLATHQLPPDEGRPVRAVWSANRGEVLVATDQRTVVQLTLDAEVLRYARAPLHWPESLRQGIFTLSSAKPLTASVRVYRNPGRVTAISVDSANVYTALATGQLVIWHGGLSGSHRIITASEMCAVIGATEADSHVTHLSSSTSEAGRVVASVHPVGAMVVKVPGPQSDRSPEISQIAGTLPGPVALNGRRSLVAACGNSGSAVLCSLGSTVWRHHVGLDQIGWGPSALGAPRLLRWSRDGEVLVVAFENRGLGMWHHTGVLLFCTLLRAGGVAPTPHLAPQPPPHNFDDSGLSQRVHGRGKADLHTFRVDCVDIDEASGALYVVGLQRPRCLLQLDLVRAASVSSPAQNKGPHVLLQSARSVWFFNHTDGDFVAGSWEPVTPPQAYISVNYPLRYVACSDCGNQLCVSGWRGCALYSRPLRKWRLFGVQEQEREVEVVAPPVWCTNVVICLPSKVRSRGPDEHLYELVFYSRFHLHRSSVLLRVPLHTKPELLDCVKVPGGVALAALHSAPAQSSTRLVTYLRLVVCTDTIQGKSGQVTLSLEEQREIVLEDVDPPVFTMRLLPSSPPPFLLLHGSSGQLRVVPQESSIPASVAATGVISCWTDARLAEQGLAHVVAYTMHSTQLLAISLPTAAKPASLVTATQLSAADSDALPVGILTGEGLIVSAAGGVGHEGVYASGRPRWHVCGRTLPYAHAILLALFLCQLGDRPVVPGIGDACAEVARGLQENASFVDAMDYLLHSVLHYDELVVAAPGEGPIDRQQVLRLVLGFLSGYAEFHTALVHSLRKADPATWPLVFAECPPTRLFSSAVRSGCVREAALLVRVLQAPRGGSDGGPESAMRELRSAAAAARHLFPLTLAMNEFTLATELLRFLRLLRGEMVTDSPPHLPCLDQVEPGLVSGGDADPLLGSAWLRLAVRTGGRRLLAAARIRTLGDMLEAMALSTSAFINKQWPLCGAVVSTTQDLLTLFDSVHQEYGLPRASKSLTLPGSGRGGETSVERLLGPVHRGLLRQWYASGGEPSEVDGVIGNAAGCFTPTQVHLVLVPPALAAVKAARQQCAAAGCAPLTLLLSTLLVDTSAVRGALAECSETLGRAYGDMLRADRNRGYSPLAEWLEGGREKTEL
eukprot:TRINITY_DN3435_c0_g1_i5.p1 TRINITY_DN3435_c0_g1~~TRINITY_DN3435_c0_g1_i5.p1  ORF type:complete len:1173 (+),score=348.21 TRINITY_DN3435_c0_g1_i5:263-3781(+)